ncbi:hypothetical protein HJ071_09970 [Vibrio parahaemolyticus]|nr:hypothetical protein [Vibrio parahaemolyticus]
MARLRFLSACDACLAASSCIWIGGGAFGSGFGSLGPDDKHMFTPPINPRMGHIQFHKDSEILPLAFYFVGVTVQREAQQAMQARLHHREKNQEFVLCRLC